MARDSNDPFEYDVALSFANRDRAIAEGFAGLLNDRGIKAFLDEYNEADSETWGRDVVTHLVNLYARKAHYCLLLISRHYPLKTWTEEERASAQERALRDADEYILPIRLDDSEVPGITEVSGYRDLRQNSVESIVDFLEGKLARARDESGPPSESHDLRSGNIPTTS